MENAIILCSGGFDSVVTAYKVKQTAKSSNSKNLKASQLQHDANLILLFFDYNQRPLQEELACVKQTAKDLNAKLKIIKLPWLGEFSTSIINNKRNFKPTTDNDLKETKKTQKDVQNWWVPARNTIFLTAALALAESIYLKTKEHYDIYIGLKDEGQVHFKDTTPEFLQKINELQKHATDKGDFKILAPFINKDKDELVKIGLELKVPFQYTYSCYINNGFKGNIPIHCGKCLNCVLRKKAFYWANEKDPSIYKK